jgi:tRNA G18 (ribose-2'-O)-methylase SpoU
MFISQRTNLFRTNQNRLVSRRTSLYFGQHLKKQEPVLRIHHIQSLEIPGLVTYKTLRQMTEHERSGIFVAEGEKVVARLAESELSIISVLITSEWLEVYHKRLEAKSGEIEVYVAAKDLLSTIVGFHLHQGIMAVARIPAPSTLEEVIARSEKPLLFVGIDGMTNSENLGVLVRNCVAFGVQALIVGERSSSPYLRRAVRNSMGTIFKLPVIQSDHLVTTIHELKTRFGVRVIAAHPHDERQLISAVNYRGDCCLVFGSEGNGISPDVLAACTENAAIPMQRGVDSLNVASASAVFLYEVLKQRKV